MKIGTELVARWRDEIEQRYVDRAIVRVDGGAQWLSLDWRGAPSLFFSWSPEALGLCSFTARRAKALSKALGQPTPFLAALIKYLSGARLLLVEQPHTDRILRLSFSRFVGAGAREVYDLLLEMAGRPTLTLLLDGENRIVEASRHIAPDENRYRSVQPGLPYEPPPRLDTCLLTPDMSDEELTRALPRAAGLGGALSQRLADLATNEGSLFLRHALFDQPPVLQWDDRVLTCCGLLLPGARPASGSALDESVNRVAGELEARALKDIARSANRAITREIGRRRKHLSDLENLLAASAHRDEWRHAGEAIIQNMGALTRGASGDIELPVWDEGGQSAVVVHLDPARSIKENAERYFKKYRKLSVDHTSVSAQIETLRGELNDLTALEENLHRVDEPAALRELAGQVEEQFGHPRKTGRRRREAPQPPHLRLSTGGTTILVGMNERGNRFVTFQASRPDDLWFHVHERPGSHVVLREPPSDPDALQRARRAAASLALFYSADTSPLSDVDCLPRKYVRHIAGAGPAQVTYRHSEPVRASRDEWRELIDS